jgi:hypothetical protein
MAINIIFLGAGNAGAGTTSVGPTAPAGTLVGEMLLFVVINKYPTNGPAAPTGGAGGTWNLGAQATGGSGAAGADSGTIYVTVYWKLAETGDAGATFTSAIASGNAATSRILRFGKSADFSWDTPVFTSGTFNTPGTAWSVTTGNLDLLYNDMVVAFSGINGNTYGYLSQALTQPTATNFTAFPEALLVDAGSNQGDDVGYVVSTHGAYIADSTKPCIYAMTASGSGVAEPAGATILCRLREIGAYARTKNLKKNRGTIFVRRKKKTPQQRRDA